ncbi:MAG: hypothetical protein EOO90_13235 [Pedobacter sp.]|nr:MAG: hypothetical protein EOO90_13235 [Pedobacter sp.]
MLKLSPQMGTSLLLFLTFACFINRSYAQELPDINKISSQTHSSIGNLISKINKENPNNITKSAIVSLNKNATSLLKTASDRKVTDTAYLRSLIALRSQIDGLTKIDLNQIKVSELNAMATDYSVKMNASPPGLSQQLLTGVKVTVTKANNGTSGYMVKASYMWDFDSKNPRFAFNNPTNNAVRVLAPGYYMIWLEKDGKLVESREVLIGAERETKQEIKF